MTFIKDIQSSRNSFMESKSQAKFTSAVMGAAAWEKNILILSLCCMYVNVYIHICMCYHASVTKYIHWVGSFKWEHGMLHPHNFFHIYLSKSRLKEQEGWFLNCISNHFSSQTEISEVSLLGWSTLHVLAYQSSTMNSKNTYSTNPRAAPMIHLNICTD